MNVIFLLFSLILLLIMYLVRSDHEGVQLDYTEQPWLYNESQERWDGAHAAMDHHLASNSYITFDLRYKVTPTRTLIPGSLVKFNCNDLASAAAKIAKVWVNNQQELSAIVKKYNKGIIRVSGGHHTFNDISITNDTIIRTYNLKNVLEINKQKKTITVEVGILLQDLNLCLKDNGLALHILPAIPYQSLGGVVATSSHGSRWNMGSMSSAVLEMTLILADGSVRTFKRGDPFFRAVQVNLGCLGVIHSVKMQCVDLFAVKHHRDKSVWSKILPNIGDYLQKDIFWQCYIRPDTADLSTTMYLRSLVDLTTVKEELGKNRDKSVKKIDDKLDYGIYVLTKNEEASFYTETEIGVPVEMLEPAVNDVIKLIQGIKHKGWKYGKSVLIRFTGADSSYLSMTAGRDTVFIDIFQDASRVRDPITINLFKDFQDLLVSQYNGRPHWGKANSLTPAIVKQVYGDQAVDAFNNVRNTLDPNRVFTNDYIRRALGK